MIKTAKLFFSVLLVSTFTWNQAAFAQACYDQSPNLTSQGDDYYNFDKPVKLTSRENKQLTQLLKRMDKAWKGSLQQIDCIGPDQAPERNTKKAKVNVKANLDSSTRLAVYAEKRFIKNGVNNSDHFVIPSLENTFELSLEGNTLTFAEKYRKANVARGDSKRRSSRLVETIYKIAAIGNTLKVVRSFYSNGVFVGEEKWMLTAD